MYIKSLLTHNSYSEFVCGQEIGRGLHDVGSMGRVVIRIAAPVLGLDHLQPVVHDRRWDAKELHHLEALERLQG